MCNGTTASDLAVWGEVNQRGQTYFVQGPVLHGKKIYLWMDSKQKAYLGTLEKVN